jgi:hypothetical protein
MKWFVNILAIFKDTKSLAERLSSQTKQVKFQWGKNNQQCKICKEAVSKAAKIQGSKLT